MKKSRLLPSSPSPRKTSRARILVALGAIGLSAVSYECGQSSRDDRISQLEASSSAKVKGLLESKNDMRQCRQVVKRLARARRYTPRQIKEVEREISQPDEAQCIDIMDKAALEKAKKLANFLCITNPDDIDEIAVAMRRGHTELHSVEYHGKMLRLIDPDTDPIMSNSRYYVHLDEQMECIPSEYIEFDSNDDEEMKGMMEKMADGDYGDVVDNFDPEAVCPSGEELGPLEERFCTEFDDFQRNLDEVTDSETKGELACELLARDIARDIQKDSRSYMSSSEEEVRTRMKNLYLESLFRSMDIDYEKGVLNCLFPQHKSLSDQEPVEEAFEEIKVEDGFEDEDYEEEN